MLEGQRNRSNNAFLAFVAPVEPNLGKKNGKVAPDGASKNVEALHSKRERDWGDCERDIRVKGQKAFH